VGVQEVRWDKGGTEPADSYTLFHGNENADHLLGTGCFVHKGIILTFKRVKFGSDRVILRGRWCDIVLNVHEPAEDKSDVKRTAFMRNDSLYAIIYESTT
jgi:hypothetical protein